VTAASDAVVDLLEDQPWITGADLARVPGLRPDELSALAQMIPQVPPLVANLLEAEPETPSATPSKVFRPLSSLRGAIKPMQFPGTWLRPGGSTPVTVMGIAADGLVIELGERPKENYLMKLRLEAPEGALELCGNAVLSTPRGPQHRTEVRVFALGGKVKETFSRMYSGH
jgi:hypothetical protein